MMDWDKTIHSVSEVARKTGYTLAAGLMFGFDTTIQSLVPGYQFDALLLAAASTRQGMDILPVRTPGGTCRNRNPLYLRRALCPPWIAGNRHTVAHHRQWLAITTVIGIPGPCAHQRFGPRQATRDRRGPLGGSRRRYQGHSLPQASSGLNPPPRLPGKNAPAASWLY